MKFTRNMSVYNLLLFRWNVAAVTGNSGTIWKGERVRLSYISFLLLISDDDVIVIDIVRNDRSKNNLEQKMIGSKIIDRVRIYMTLKEKTIDERFIIQYVPHTEIISSVWVHRNIWGIIDNRDLYQITKNGANNEIVLIL